MLLASVAAMHARAEGAQAARRGPLRREEGLRDVALAGVGHDHDDALALRSGRAATCSAAHSAAPQEMPASTPARRAHAQAVWIASSSETAMTSSISSRLSTGGTKPAPIPWMRCGPGTARPRAPASRAARRRRRAARGLTCSRRYSPDPVIVPPVPTPATSTSTWPSRARAISGPVVAAVGLGVGGVGELVGQEDVVVARHRARRLRPPRPCRPSTR